MKLFIFLIHFCYGIGLHGTHDNGHISDGEIGHLKVITSIEILICAEYELQIEGFPKLNKKQPYETNIFHEPVCVCVVVVVTQSNFFDIFFGNKPSIRTCNKCKCGIPNRRPRMIGGTDLKPYEFPWLAQIIIKDEAPIEATLINSRYVITSAIAVYG